MTRPAVLLVCLAVAFAGCLSSGAEDRPEAAEEPTLQAAEGGGTGSKATPPTAERPAPRANAEPSARLVADVTSGKAPLHVVFSIEAADPDGDPLSWWLDADGDDAPDFEGTEAPASATWWYEAGNHSARLAVTDGIAIVEATSAIDVWVAVPVLPDPIVFIGTLQGAWTPTGEHQGGSKSHGFNFTAALGAVEGLSVDVVNTTQTTRVVDFELFAPDGTPDARRAYFNETLDAPSGAAPPAYGPYLVEDEALLLQPGEWRLVVHPGLAVNGGYRATIGFA